MRAASLSLLTLARPADCRRLQDGSRGGMAGRLQTGTTRARATDVDTGRQPNWAARMVQAGLRVMRRLPAQGAAPPDGARMVHSRARDGLRGFAQSRTRL